MAGIVGCIDNAGLKGTELAKELGEAHLLDNDNGILEYRHERIKELKRVYVLLGQPFPEIPKQIPKVYGGTNTIVSIAEADALHKELNSILIRVNSNLDPAVLAIIAKLAAFHIEALIRSSSNALFADVLKNILKDPQFVAENEPTIREYLVSAYETHRKKWGKYMTPADELLSKYEIVPGGFANDEQRIAIDSISDWLSTPINDDNRHFVLEGAGGTGKTAVVTKIIDEAIKKGALKADQVAYTATTHKAKAVLTASTRQTATTIWKALGLRPPDKKTLVKDPKSDSIIDSDQTNVKGKKLVIIDETSMVGEDMVGKIIEKAKGLNIRVLYLGDSAQMAPIRTTFNQKKVVGELVFGVNSTSPIFNIESPTGNAHFTNRIKLSTPQRQNSSSPILKVTKKFTEVLNNPAELLEAAINKTELIPRNVRENDFDPTLNAGVVYAYDTTNKDLTKNDFNAVVIKAFVADYINNPYNTRIITGVNHEPKPMSPGSTTIKTTTNQSVYQLNRLVFAAYHPDRVYGIHAKGDIVMAYNSVVLGKDNKDEEIGIWNSSEYEVIKAGPLKEIPFYLNTPRESVPLTIEQKDSGNSIDSVDTLQIPAQAVTLKDIASGEIISLDIPAITDGNKTFGPFNSLNMQISKELAEAEEQSDVAYKAFIEKNASAIRLGDIELHPAFALTVWKSQGSTYRNTYVMEDTLRNMAFWDKQSHSSVPSKIIYTGTKKSYHAMYVATSRPTDKLVLISKANKETNNKELDSADSTVQKKNVVTGTIITPTVTVEPPKTPKPSSPVGRRVSPVASQGNSSVDAEKRPTPPGTPEGRPVSNATSTPGTAVGRRVNTADNTVLEPSEILFPFSSALFEEMLKNEYGEVSNIDFSFNFLKDWVSKNILTANWGIGKEFEGKSLESLIQISTSKTPGIFNIPTEMFEDSNSLAIALVSLGVKAKAAINIAMQYELFEHTYLKLRAAQLDISPDSKLKHGVPLLRQPMYMAQEGSLDEQGNSIGTLPPQIILAMSISTDFWAAQNFTDTNFGSLSEAADFLYGDRRVNLSQIEVDNLNAASGLPYIEISQDVGRNAQQLLGISATSTPTQPFLDSLSTAMGMLALEVINSKNGVDPAYSARIDIDTHLWRFLQVDNNGDDIVVTKEDKAVVEGKDSRNWKHKTSYKHIKFHQNGELQSRSLIDVQEATAELAEVMQTLGAAPSQDNLNTILTEPATSENLNIKQALSKAPKRMGELIKTLQSEAWEASDTMSALAALSALPEKVDIELVEDMIGIVAYDPIHETTRRADALDASNKNKRDALKNTLEANSANLLKSFFFKYQVMGNLRLMMRGFINPQNNKVPRWLVKPKGTSTYTKDNIHYFKYAVMQAFGFSVDKETPVNIAKSFNEYLNDADIVEVAKLLTAKSQDWSVIAEKIRIIRGKPEYANTIADTRLSLLSGLVALSKYMDYHDALQANSDSNPTFKSDIPIEIDGITNGFANTLVQFPVFKSAALLEKHLNQVGIYIGKDNVHRESGIFSETSTVNEELGETPITDVYIDLKSKIENVGTAEDAEFYYTEYTSWKNDKITEFTNTYTEKSKALSNLVPLLSELTRDFVKYPFMIFMYGGGVKSISEGAAGNVIDAMYEKMGKLHKAYHASNDKSDNSSINNEISEFVNNLKIIGVKEYFQVATVIKAPLSKSTGVGRATTSKNRTAFQKFTFDENAVAITIGELLAPKFGLGLNALLQSIIPTRSAVVQAVELQHAIFLSRYDIARKKWLAEHNRDMNDNLTDKEIEEIFRQKEMIKWVPKFVGPMAYLDKDKDGNVIPNMEYTDFTTRKTAKLGAKRSVEVTVKSFKEGQSTRVLTSLVQHKEFVAPGVSAVARAIVTMESTVLARALEKVPNVLMLFDAVFGRPEDIKKLEEVYNKTFIEYQRNFSILGQANDQLSLMISDAIAYDTDNDTNIMNEAKHWIMRNAFINKNAKEENKVSFDELVTGVKDNTEKNKNKRTELFKRWDIEGVKSSNLFFNVMSESDPNSPITPINTTANEINVSMRSHAQSKLISTPEYNALPDGVKAKIQTLINESTIEPVLSMLSEYDSKYLASYIDLLLESEKSLAQKDRKLTNRISAIRKWNGGSLWIDIESDVDLLVNLLTDIHPSLWAELIPEQNEISAIQDYKNQFFTLIESEFNNRLKLDIGINWVDPNTDTDINQEILKYTTPTTTELNSLDNQRKENPAVFLKTAISPDNILQLLSKFAGVSRKYFSSDADMAVHTAALNRVLQPMLVALEKIDSISLEASHINGITHGEYSPASERVNVYLSRDLPGGRNEHSPQEVYMHELVHAFLVKAMSINSGLIERIIAIATSLKKSVDAQGGYKIFLATIPGYAEGTAEITRREIDYAKEQYEYLFGEAATDVPEEVIAYVLTNPAMITFALAHDRRTNTRGTSVIQRLQHLFDQIVDFVVRLIEQNHAQNSYEELIAIAEKLMSIQSANETVADKLISKTAEISDTADKSLIKFISEKTASITSSTPGVGIRKYVNAVIGLGAVQFSNNAAIQQVTTDVFGRMHGALSQLIREAGDGVLTKPLIKQLLFSLGKVSKLSYLAEVDTLRRLADSWKSIKDKDIPFATRKAITRVVYRTDLSSLLSVGYNTKQILTLLDDKGNRRDIKNKLINDMGVDANSDVIRYANDLGYFISTRKRTLPQGHWNVDTLAAKYLTVAQNTPENRIRLDAIATLTAIDHQNKLDVNLVKTLMNTEIEADPKDNAFKYILESHRAYTIASRNELFYANSKQMVKGFTSEKIDNLTDARTGLNTPEVAKRMRKDGYTESYNLKDIPGVPGAHTVLYVSRWMPEIKWVAGILSTTGMHHKGTLISELIARDPSYQNSDKSVNIKKVNRYIRRLRRKEENDAKNGVTYDNHHLSPLYDENGNTVDYRVVMDYASQEKIFKPEIEFQDVFAHMQSSYSNKKNTITVDLQTVNLLVDEWVRMEPLGKRKFINILDKDSKHYDKYNVLPDEVKKYLNQFAVNGKFLVREEIVDKVFGYRAMDLSNIPVIQAEVLGSTRKILRRFHHGLKKVMSFGMERIVMANINVILSNLRSNFLQLTIFKKIPPKYIVSKLAEGRAAFKRYEEDQRELRDVHHFMQITPAGNKRNAMQKQFNAVQERIIKNPIHQLSALGVQSLLVEDVNTASREGYMYRAHELLQADGILKYTDKIPSSVSGLARNMLLTKASTTYKLQKETVQLTDFLSRFVMISYAVDVQGQDFDTALHEAIDAFVLFDENMHPLFEAINSMGFTMFLSFALRVLRPARRYLVKAPATVAAAAGTQYITDIDALNIMNSTAFTGNFPNLFVQDDLLEEIFTIPLPRNISDILSGDAF